MFVQYIKIVSKINSLEGKRTQFTIKQKTSRYSGITVIYYEGILVRPCIIKQKKQ